MSSFAGIHACAPAAHMAFQETAKGKSANDRLQPLQKIIMVAPRLILSAMPIFSSK